MTVAISLTDGTALTVQAIDETKAPAFRDRYERAKSARDAREMIKAVDECIEFGVPMLVQLTANLNLPPSWMTVRSHAVQAVTAA